MVSIRIIMRRCMEIGNFNNIISTEYPTKAVRPKNSIMSEDKLVGNGFARLPKLEDAVEWYVKVL